MRRSNRHNLLFLGGEKLLDFADRRIGGFLHVIGLPVVFVLADLVIFLELFEKIETVAANMAHGHASALGVFMGDFYDFAAPLLIQFWNAQPEQLPFGGSRQTEIGSR